MATPVRVLHVVGAMRRGGLENWVMHVLRNYDRDRFSMDIAFLDGALGEYEGEIQALGLRSFPCPHHRNPPRFARRLRQILAEHGRYDIIHSHPHHYSGWVVSVARSCGVPVRIGHSHNDYRWLHRDAGLPRRLYLQAAKRLIRRDATHGLAASREAAASLFGEEWDLDPRWRVLYYGIDLEPFRVAADAGRIRHELGLSREAFVLCNIARLAPAKNHAFLLEVMSEVAKREPNARLLLVGDGPLRGEIERDIWRRGLHDHVLLAGMRSDVPKILMGAANVVVFPSFFEGLPLALLEAQAAALPIVCSDQLTKELELFPELIRRVPLGVGAGAWAEAALSDHRTIDQAEAVRRFAQSPFSLCSSVSSLQEYYSESFIAAPAVN